MSVVRFNIATELRKALRGKATKVSLESLLHIAAPVYLEAAKAAKEQAGEQKDIAELERLFNLEDPRH